MHRGRDRRGTAIGRALVAIGASCALFLLLEGAARATHLFGASLPWSQPDPVLRWRFTPGSAYWVLKENDHPVTGRINRDGWRDKDWALEKPVGAYRIAVLGDSYVEAFQVESDRTFLALAECLLRERSGRSVELMNFGRSDATQTEEHLILTGEVGRFAPDLVVLVFTPENDIRDIGRDTCPNPARPFYTVGPDGQLVLDTSFNRTRSFRLKMALHQLKRRSALASLILERLSAAQAQRRAAALGPAGGEAVAEAGPTLDDGALTLCTRHPDPAYAKSYELSKHLIREMAAYCRSRGIRFLLVCGDTTAYRPEMERQYAARDGTFEPNFFEDNLRAYAASLDIGYAGLQRLFRRRYEMGGRPLHWGHWNYEGHEAVAEALAEAIQQMMGSHAGS